VVSGSRDGKYLSQGLTRYYQEIYMPAIKEAGFEPVRADELFTTGSVVEQIWEQIEKAKLLLADLSGKNPNVFYELGLAHAAKKPVVFTASLVDDVPFDVSSKDENRAPSHCVRRADAHREAA
jgi:hypothetical protein